MSSQPTSRKRKPPRIMVLSSHITDDGDELEDLERIARALSGTGWQVDVVNAEDDVDRLTNACVLLQPTVIVNQIGLFLGDVRQAAHAIGMLELWGFVYTGGDALCLATCAHDDRLDLLMSRAGVPFSAATPADGESDVALAGRTLSAVVIGNENPHVLPLVEATKVDGDEVISLVADVPNDIASKIADTAKSAFAASGCRDVGRVDFRFDEKQLLVVAIEPCPDLGPNGELAIASRELEGGYDALIVELVRAAFERVPREEMDQLIIHPEPTYTAKTALQSNPVAAPEAIDSVMKPG